MLTSFTVAFPLIAIAISGMVWRRLKNPLLFTMVAVLLGFGVPRAVEMLWAMSIAMDNQFWSAPRSDSPVDYALPLVELGLLLAVLWPLSRKL